MKGNIMDQSVRAFISRSALRHNIRLLQQLSRNALICAVVKADAYGHNVALVIKALRGLKVAYWGVANLNEALELRALKVREPVMIMCPLTRCEGEKTISEQIKLMRRHEIRTTLASDEVFDLLEKIDARKTRPLLAHIKVDTGMGRNGCLPDFFLPLLRKAIATRGLIIEGVFSHFACAAAQNLRCARKQLAVFKSLLNQMSCLGIPLPLRHISNSGGIFNLPEASFDMVRPGQAVYGYSVPGSKTSGRLMPVMRVEAPVIFTKWIAKGATCGYGCTFKSRRKTRIGLLPVGYADGYNRRLSNTGFVDFNGKLIPIIGRISMDLTIIDLTDVPEAVTGSRICVISNRRAHPHSIESIAGFLGTVPHEVGCCLGKRIQRILI
jgi:alanine racemase